MEIDNLKIESIIKAESEDWVLESVGNITEISHKEGDWIFQRVGEIYNIVPREGVSEPYYEQLAEELY